MNNQLKFNSDFIYKQEKTTLIISHLMSGKIVFVRLNWYNKNVLTSENILLWICS